MLTNLASFLTTQGLIEGLKNIQTEIQKLPTDAQGTILEKKRNAMKKCLKGIYFDTLSDEQIIEHLRLEGRFSPDYLGIYQILHALFVDNLPIEQMLSDTVLTLPSDWIPSDAILNTHYSRLNESHGYFKDPAKEMALKTLFNQLVQRCRSIAVLVEQNNTADDTMAYDYAYRLMALFVGESKDIPALESLSTMTAKLLNSQKKDKPFHDVLLVKLKLPDARTITDRAGWISFIKQYNQQAFSFFEIAHKLESKLSKKAPTTLEKANEGMALCTFARADSDIEFATLCYENKASENTFNCGLDYMTSPSGWPKKTTDTIPNVLITGKGIIEQRKDLAAGYYWVKLPPTDKRALILGEITDCCQSIDGHSSQCVKDAVSLSDNGLYVLLKRKRGDKDASPFHPDGRINDDFQIIGQSYVWKSTTGNICLDSIECLRDSVPPSVLKKIMLDFATKIMEDDPTIKRVTVGRGGKTPSELFGNASIYEVMRHGHRYGDSETQYCIQSCASKLTSEQHAELDALLSKHSCSPSFRDCVDYLLNYLINDPTEIIKELSTLLNRDSKFINKLQPSSLLCFLSLNPSPKITDFYPFDIDSLEKMSQEEQIATLHGISLAQIVWNISSSLKQLIPILPLVPIDQRFFLLKTTDKDGQNVLTHPDSNSTQLIEILNLLLKDQQPDPAKNLNTLTAIFELFPEYIRRDTVKKNNSYAKGIFEYLNERYYNDLKNVANALILILKLYPEEQRLEVIKDMGFANYVAKNPTALSAMIALLPEDQRLKAVMEKDNCGASALHHAAKNPDALTEILALLPEDQRLKAVMEKDNRGASVLHHAAENPDALTEILALYPEDQRLQAVMEKDSRGASALHHAAENPDALTKILALYPEEQRRAAVMEKDNYGHTLLDVLVFKYECSHVRNPDAFAAILKFYSQDARRAVLSQATDTWESGAEKQDFFDRVLILASKKSAADEATPTSVPEQSHPSKRYSFFSSDPEKEAASSRSLLDDDSKTTPKPLV